jgi:hypothetical protein
MCITGSGCTYLSRMPCTIERHRSSEVRGNVPSGPSTRQAQRQTPGPALQFRQPGQNSASTGRRCLTGGASGRSAGTRRITRVRTRRSCNHIVVQSPAAPRCARGSDILENDRSCLLLPASISALYIPEAPVPNGRGERSRNRTPFAWLTYAPTGDPSLLTFDGSRWAYSGV